jgi:phenylpropionate dioxygenase-like ring-hydroxylating dioxygenase large terminal subunit
VKKAIFSPKWYTEPSFFDKEKKNLFNKVWNFTGLANAVKKPGDFFTIQICSQEIVVHNIAGKLKAYLNVCPHRGGPLVVEKFGNGATVCKYHGWSFREGGDLTGVSNIEWFNHESEKDSCGKSLKSYPLTTIGPFIFIFIGPNPIPIESQFSQEVIATLSSYGELSASITSEFKANFNWKLNMENVKDFLHPYYVHEQSFKPLLGFEQAPTVLMKKADKVPGEFFKKPSLKDLSFIQRGEFSVTAAQRWWTKFIKITQPDNCFQNIFLFPNVNMFSVSGTHYVVQQYLPTSPSTFLYRLNVSFPEILEKFESRDLLYSLLQIERNVIKEDEIILDRLQKSMGAQLPEGHFAHGDYESYIMEQQIYLRDEVYCE